MMMKKTLLGMRIQTKKLTLCFVRNTKMSMRKDSKYSIAMAVELTGSYYSTMGSV